jgi:hypothetical protein
VQFMRLDPSKVRAMAMTTAIGLGIIAAFQAALAIGVPWGRAAWGGTSATLQPDLRLASGVAAVVWLFAVAVVLGLAGYWGPGWSAVFRRATWLLAPVLALGAIVNFASSSVWERFGWGPLALALAVCCVVLARSSGGSPTHDEPENALR